MFRGSAIFLVFFVAVLHARAQVSLEKGLVLHLPFNGNTNDVSSNQMKPVFSKVDFTDDRFGNKNAAALFNGSNSYIQFSNTSSLCPDEMTLFAIVKPMGFYSGLCGGNSIIEKGRKDDIPGFYALRFSAGTFTKDCHERDTVHQNFEGVAYGNGKSSVDIYISLDVWYHVAFTFSKQHSRLYIDGELISSYGNNKKTGKNKEDLFIGKKDHPAYPYWFKGLIDEIRIYNRALSPDEIAELYTQLSKITTSTN